MRGNPTRFDRRARRLWKPALVVAVWQLAAMAGSAHAVTVVSNTTGTLEVTAARARTTSSPPT